VLAQLIELVFPVRQGERRLTATLFVHGLLVIGTFAAGRMVRDTLFLVHSDQDSLAWMYVVSALAVSVVGLLYRPLAVRLRPDLAAIASSILFSGLFLLCWSLERQQQPWLYGALYVFVEVLGAIAILQFWMVVNDLFNSREARRLYGVIGAGGSISNLVVGVATVKIASWLGASALLLLCAFLSLAAAASAYFAGRFGRTRILPRTIGAVTAPALQRPGPGWALQSTHLRWIALLSMVTFVTTTLIDFQFKVVAGATFQKDQLAIYFGYFNLVIGVLGLLLQLFGTTELLKRAGVVATLAILPLSLVFGNVALLVIPSLAAAATARGADALLRYSINDSSTQILYLPFAPQLRVSAKAYVDGLVKPVSIAICGLGLVAYGQYLGGDPLHLAWVGLALSLGWVAIVVALRSRYVRSLEGSLRQRRLELDLGSLKAHGETAGDVLSRVLKQGDPSLVLHALQLLPQLEDIHLDHQVEYLLEHQLPEIRIAALEYFSRRQTMRFANSIFRRFDDEDSNVRAAAISAFCSIGRDKAVRSVGPFLSNPDPAVRGAAIAGMIQFGGLDGILAAGEALRRLLTDNDPRMRKHAGRVLGAAGVKTLYQSVLELMDDPDPSVRREGIQAAGQLQCAEFVIPLISRCQDLDVGREATTALVRFGPAVIPDLARILDSRFEEAARRCGAARVLGRIGGADAVEVILRHIDEPDEELRTQVYQGLARATRSVRLPNIDRKHVRAALTAETERAYQVLVKAEVLRLEEAPSPAIIRRGPNAADALLASALADKLAQTERRIFMLLAVLHVDTDIGQIHARIREATDTESTRRRANAIELLENVLSKPVRRIVLPLLDDMPRKQKIRAFAYLLTSSSRLETVVALCRDDMAWVRACAIYYVAEHQLAAAAEAVIAAIRDPSPIVRESALACCYRIAPGRAREIADPLLRDEAPMVRGRAMLIAQQKETLA
jgi:AAA family ATP:ADP antiporter